MKQFKSDGRFKFHDKGLCYIVEFGWANLSDRALFSRLIAFFKEMYGPEKEKKYRENGYAYWTMNENWRCEQNRSARRRRIYLKDESVLTIALLKVG